MKTLITIIFITMTFSCFGQTKGDLLDCLKLVFNQDLVQPAFSNHENKGRVVIVTGKTSITRATRPSLHNVIESLTQVDFLDFKQDIKVLREEELEAMGIQEIGVSSLSASGNESEIKIRLSSNLIDERLSYTWVYKLIKISSEWEIIADNLSTLKGASKNF